MSGQQVLEGRMSEGARACCSRLDDWSLVATFTLPSAPGHKTLEVRAIKPYGQGAAAANACKRRAAELRAGVLVRITAKHLQTRRGGLQAAPVDELAAPDIDAAQRSAFIARFGD